MFKEKISSVLNNNSVYGVDIKLLGDNDIEYYIIKLQKSKNEINIIEKVQGLNFESLFDYQFNKNIPIYLNVRGKGIISKILAFEKGQTDENLIQKAIPNANNDELTFYSTIIDSEKKWINIIRTKILNNILNKFEKNDLYILKIFFHYNVLNNVIPLIDSSAVNLNNNLLIFEKQKLKETKIEHSPDKLIQIGDDKFSSNFLPSYALAFSNFNNITEFLSNQTIKNNEVEFKNRKIFQVSFKLILGFFFTSLLLNFMVFQSKSKEFNTLNQNFQINKVQLDKLERLRIDKERKSLFFNKTGLISDSKKSYYIEKLAITNVEGITWTELSINPSKSKIEKGDDIQFQINTIDLKGETKSSSNFNSWVSKLKNEEWIKSVNIKNFQKNNRADDSKFYIQIIIQ